MTKMPTRIMKGDKVRIDGIANIKKYRALDTDVFVVVSIDKIGGSPRLYVERDGATAQDGVAMLWARDCKLAWPKSCPERKKALGYV